MNPSELFRNSHVYIVEVLEQQWKLYAEYVDLVAAVQGRQWSLSFLASMYH